MDVRCEQLKRWSTVSGASLSQWRHEVRDEVDVRELGVTVSYASENDFW